MNVRKLHKNDDRLKLVEGNVYSIKQDFEILVNVTKKGCPFCRMLKQHILKFREGCWYLTSLDSAGAVVITHEVSAQTALNIVGVKDVKIIERNV